MHQHIGVVEKPYHHKDLSRLSVEVIELLHDSRVEVQSCRIVRQQRRYHPPVKSRLES
jgi:hypothetical protein